MCLEISRLSRGMRLAVAPAGALRRTSQSRQAQRDALRLRNPLRNFRFNPPKHSDKQPDGRSDACPRADGGFDMNNARYLVPLLPVLGLLLGALDAEAQSFRVQCPMSTPSHPLNANGTPNANIKCQQIAGGHGYATMGDGSTTYLFGFGPLSGLPDIYNGLPGTEVNSTFNTTFGPDTGTGATNNLVGMPDGNFTFKG